MEKKSHSGPLFLTVGCSRNLESWSETPDEILPSDDGFRECYKTDICIKSGNNVVVDIVSQIRLHSYLSKSVVELFKINMHEKKRSFVCLGYFDLVFAG